MSVIEKVVIYLYTLVLNASNRHTQERFQHSGETISQVFRQVLHVDCIGAIDGTHVRASIAPKDQIPYIGRKGISFDMQFTFVWAGCEGITHNARIFLAAIKNPIIKFPKPPKEKYYLVDAGYPNMKGYLKPYKDAKYHLPEFRRGQPPSGLEEIFNRAHSSLRSVIERTFGVWNNRWHILDNMSAYPFKVQIKIVVASMTLHNYIRKKARGNRIFQIFNRNPEYVPFNILPNTEGIPIDTHIQR
ncbi:hypothetical protein P3X46_007583 [Hevea brasiliensis]|uniref:DDE Tnp4 domain-containing protein n=1 Tax=Hevea brasiliensis TaxID=3981 RepID=A0ABQ9MU04_HEVBR|nr:hypothetical protein P3X46_007583 [Hevea brasiliensis]